MAELATPTKRPIKTKKTTKPGTSSGVKQSWKHAYKLVALSGGGSPAKAREFLADNEQYKELINGTDKRNPAVRKMVEEFKRHITVRAISTLQSTDPHSPNVVKIVTDALQQHKKRVLPSDLQQEVLEESPRRTRPRQTTINFNAQPYLTIAAGAADVSKLDYETLQKLKAIANEVGICEAIYGFAFILSLQE